MNTVSIVFFIGVAFSYTFEDYQTEFNKTYASKEQRQQRKKIFQQRIHSYEIFNSQNHGYLLGPTKWTDRYDSEKQRSLNIKLDGLIAQWQNPIKDKGLKVSSSLSAVVDWRNKNGVSSIKDQGSCGACWAFSAIATLQSYLLIRNNTNTDLSEQYVLQCTGNGSTCNGGTIDSAIKFLIKNGAPLQQQFKYLGIYYTGSTYPITPGICAANSSSFKKPHNNSTMNMFLSQNKTVLMSLIDNGPISTVIIADENFEGYKSNIFYCNYTYNDQMINHAVQIVGYNKTGNYYIVKNSWGAQWGMKGYAHIDMDSDCAMSRAVYQLVWETILIKTLITVVIVMII